MKRRDGRRGVDAGGARDAAERLSAARALPAHPSGTRLLLCPLAPQVALHRQMEKSAREFGEWKKQRDRELLQLKKQVGGWVGATMNRWT